MRSFKAWLIAGICSLFLTGCSIGKGWLLETTGIKKCMAVIYQKGGSGTIETPWGRINIVGPGSYHSISKVCEGMIQHETEKKKVTP